MSDQTGHRRLDCSCHCGAIGVTLLWPEHDGPIPGRACGCGFCQKHGAVWTSHPEAEFWLEIDDPGNVTRYRFGTGTADFHVCRVCGVVPVATCDMDGRRYAVINIGTFDNVASEEMTAQPTDFEGETVEDRMARHKRNWTPEARQPIAAP